MFLSQRVQVLSLLQNKFGLVFFRLFDGALETSNFRFEEARSAITLLRCFLHENTQRGKIARVKFAEELGTMSKNRLRWITLVREPIWGIHSLTLMISRCDLSGVSDLKTDRMPSCCRRRISDSPLTYGSTTVDLIPGAGSFSFFQPMSVIICLFLFLRLKRPSVPGRGCGCSQPNRVSFLFAQF